MRRALIAAVVTIASAAGVAHAETRVKIDARLDPVARRVSGRTRVTLVNPTGAALERAYVWLYPNRFSRAPDELNDVNYYWVYPDEFNPGWMRLGQVRQDGRPARAHAVPHAAAGEGVLVAIDLEHAVPAGGTLALELPFAALVPERFGQFGCVDGECTLLGGWTPMLAAIDEAGWELEAAPADATYSGTLLIDGGAADVVVAGAYHARAGSVPLAGHGAYLPLYVSVARLVPRVREQHGVRVTYLSPRGPPPADDAEHAALAYSKEDHAKMALDTIDQALALMAEIGAPIPEGTAFTVVEAPLRMELAVAHPGMVVVSDRLFRIFPAKRFRKYHGRELTRALYAEWLARRAPLPGAGLRERGDDADAAASYLLDLFTIRGYKKSEFAQTLLAPVSFVPAIDQLIYAPQVAFAGAYFGAIADDDRFRDDVRRFNHRRPRASVYYEKLRDLLEPEAFGDVMGKLVRGEARLREAASSAAGTDLGWFFAQWGGRYPRVNYRLAGRSKHRADGGGWVHVIRVEKLAVAGDPPPIEPVEVLVVDGAGKKHVLKWDGQGDHAELELETPSSSLRSVTLDPRRRLVEASEPGSPEDPLYDDRTPPRWTFLYNNFGVQATSDGSLAAAADFSFRRIHDNKNLLRMQVYTTEAVQFGLFVGLSRRVGPRIAANRPLASIGAGLGFQRLEESFADIPGTRLTLSVGAGESSQLVVFEPQEGASASLGVRSTITRFDDDGMGRPRAGDFLVTWAASGEYTLITTPRPGHTLVANLEGAAVFGDIIARPQLLGAGGIGLLRGYGPAELFGRARVTGHLEWRGALTHKIDWNFGHLFWLRGVGLAGFIDVGALSSCDGYGFGGDSLFAGAGFGVRFFYDNFGVQPGMTAIDIAVPLVTRPRECLGSPASLPDRPPVVVYLQFIPPF